MSLQESQGLYYLASVEQPRLSLRSCKEHGAHERRMKLVEMRPRPLPTKQRTVDKVPYKLLSTLCLERCTISYLCLSRPADAWQQA